VWRPHHRVAGCRELPAVNVSQGGIEMTLCPIALAVGCRKCPAFKVCPLKGAIGDYKQADDAPAAEPKKNAARGAKGKR
jgi:hypothetical protein